MCHKGDDFECYPKAVLIAAETLVWDPLDRKSFIDFDEGFSCGEHVAASSWALNPLDGASDVSEQSLRSHRPRESDS